jgi:hypothetical protein
MHAATRTPSARRLALVALLFTASAAHADWQYTHWGMPKDQALLASNGALSPVLTRRAENPYIGLRGKYETGDHKFDAALLFDGGDALTGVWLSQRTPAECRSTLGDLTDKYGAGQDATIGRGPARVMWNDQTSGNRVKYIAAARGSLPAAAGEHERACEIIYEPLSKTADGL